MCLTYFLIIIKHSKNNGINVIYDCHQKGNKFFFELFNINSKNLAVLNKNL